MSMPAACCGSVASGAQHGSPPSGCGSVFVPVTGAGQSFAVSGPNRSHCSPSLQPVTGSCASQPAKPGSFGGLSSAGGAAWASAAATAVVTARKTSAHASALTLARRPPPLTTPCCTTVVEATDRFLPTLPRKRSRDRRERGRQLAARRDVELAVRVAEVPLHGLRGDEQLLRDLAIRAPGRCHLRDA